MESEQKITHRRSFPIIYSEGPDVVFQFSKANRTFLDHRRSVPGITASTPGNSISFQYPLSIRPIAEKEKDSESTLFSNEHNEFSKSSLCFKNDNVRKNSLINADESHPNKRVNFILEPCDSCTTNSSSLLPVMYSHPEEFVSISPSLSSDARSSAGKVEDTDTSGEMKNSLETVNAKPINNSSNVSTTTASITPPSSTLIDDDENSCLDKSPNGRFIKLNEVGRGAFKTVYKGLDTDDGVAVAWCELQDFYDKEERSRFREEAKMLKELQHPNIVRFYDYWEETRKGRKVIVLITELMTSGSLKSYLKNFQGELNKKKLKIIKNWCRQILNGLSFLHEKNPPIIHRDLKCDNIFITGTTGCVKIGDLGLAVLKTETFAKSMRGTMEFMAPEMFDEMYDEMVDIYAFGLCLLEMATGEYPYIECKFPTAVMKKVLSGAKPGCFYKVKEDSVREVIECCIQKNKSDRLTAAELLQHSFFMEDNGLRIDLVKDPDGKIPLHQDFVEMKIKVVDQSKRKFIHEQGDALIFKFDLNKDLPENISYELVEKNFISKDDVPFVTKSIRDRIRSFHYLRADELSESVSTNSQTNSVLKSSSYTMSPSQNIENGEDKNIQQAAVIAANVKNLNRFIVVNVDDQNSLDSHSQEPSPIIEEPPECVSSEPPKISPIPNVDNATSPQNFQAQSSDAAAEEVGHDVQQYCNTQSAQTEITDTAKPSSKSDRIDYGRMNGVLIIRIVSIESNIVRCQFDIYGLNVEFMFAYDLDKPEIIGSALCNLILKHSKNEDFAKHKLTVTASCIKCLKEIAATVAKVIATEESSASLIGRTFSQNMSGSSPSASADHMYGNSSVLTAPSSFVVISPAEPKKSYASELNQLNQNLKSTLSKSEKKGHELNLCDHPSHKRDAFTAPDLSPNMNFKTLDPKDIPQMENRTRRISEGSRTSFHPVNPNYSNRNSCLNRFYNVHSNYAGSGFSECTNKRTNLDALEVRNLLPETGCRKTNEQAFYTPTLMDSLENRLSAMLIRQQREISNLISRHQLEIHSFFSQLHQADCFRGSSDNCCSLLPAVQPGVFSHPWPCHFHRHMDSPNCLHQFCDSPFHQFCDGNSRYSENSFSFPNNSNSFNLPNAQ